MCLCELTYIWVQALRWTEIFKSFHCVFCGQVLHTTNSNRSLTGVQSDIISLIWQSDILLSPCVASEHFQFTSQEDIRIHITDNNCVNIIIININDNDNDNNMYYLFWYFCLWRLFATKLLAKLFDKCVLSIAHLI